MAILVSNPVPQAASLHKSIAASYTVPYTAALASRKPSASPLRAAWLEIWSDVEAGGGERLAFVFNAVSIVDRFELEGNESLTVSIPTSMGPGPLDDAKAAPETGPWQYVTERRVVRVVYTDLTWDEWRIIRRSVERTEAGGTMGMLEADGIGVDLNRGIAEKILANGAVESSYLLYGQSPADLLAEALTHAPEYFTAGDVEFVEDVEELDFTGTVNAIVRALAEKLGAELTVERTEAGTYAVCLRAAAGAERDVVEIRAGHNLRSLRLDGDATEQANRIYPLGADEDGARWNMGQAAWEVTAADGGSGRLTLAGEPIAFDEQLDDLYLEAAGTDTRAQILGSFAATQQVEVDGLDFASFPVGTLVYVRRDAAGVHLTYLDHPASVAALGFYPAQLLLDEVPGIDNLLPNPFLNDVTGGVPDGWNLIGGATCTVVSDELHSKYGSHSILLVGAGDGSGLESDRVPYRFTDLKPHIATQSALWPVVGTWRYEIVVIDGADVETVIPPVGSAATTSVLGGWVEDLGVAPGTDLHALGIVAFKVRMVQHGATAATGYMDAFQATNTDGGAATLYDDRASNRLWLEANTALRERWTAREEFQLTLADLYRMDPAGYPFYRLYLGAAVDVRDTELEVVVRVRVVALERDHMQPLNTLVTLGNLSRGFTNALARAQARPLREIGRQASNDPGVTAYDAEMSGAAISVTFSVTPATKSLRVWAANEESPLDGAGEPMTGFFKGERRLPLADFAFASTPGEYTIYVRAYDKDLRYTDLTFNFTATGTTNTIPATPIVSLTPPAADETTAANNARWVRAAWVLVNATDGILLEWWKNGVLWTTDTLAASTVLEHNDLAVGSTVKVRTRFDLPGAESSPFSAEIVIAPWETQTGLNIAIGDTVVIGPDTFIEADATWTPCPWAGVGVSDGIYFTELEWTVDGVPQAIQNYGAYSGQGNSRTDMFDPGSFVKYRVRYAVLYGTSLYTPGPWTAYSAEIELT